MNSAFFPGQRVKFVRDHGLPTSSLKAAGWGVAAHVQLGSTGTLRVSRSTPWGPGWIVSWDDPDQGRASVPGARVVTLQAQLEPILRPDNEVSSWAELERTIPGFERPVLPNVETSV